MKLPLPVISLLNDIRNDVNLAKEKTNELMAKVVNTRQLDAYGIYDIFDELSQKCAFRLADYYKSGNMEQAKTHKMSEVQFPEAKVKPS